jgi:DNA-binding response OmpR family regulator
MKILISDDEALWANLIKGIFEGHGYEILVTVKGKEVPDLAIKEKVDLVLLDVNFPDTNGFDILEKLQSNPASRIIPVVLLTAQVDPSDLKRGLELGASDYVEKNSSSLELLARAQSVLRRKTRFQNFYNYDSIFNNFPYALSLIQDGKIVFCNSTFRVLFGFEESDNLNAIKYDDIISEDDIPLYKSIYDQVLTHERTEYFKCRGKKYNNTEINLKVSLNKIKIIVDDAVLFCCQEIIEEKEI